VYALGSVAYRALVGRLPFSVQDDMQVLAHQIFSPAPPPSSLGVAIDASTELVLMTALRKHPANRYQTMQAMLEDLERLVGMRNGDPEGAPAAVVPDRYEFTSEMGESAGRVLNEKLAKGRRP
jgi:serine/threonine-protein kinase